MLKVLLITDERAGHESVSNGLIRTLRERWEIESTKIYAKIRAKFLKKIATIFLNHTKINRKNIPLSINLFYKEFTIDFSKKYDLIISTGGDTSFLNIMLARYFGIPNIYCSSLRGLKNGLFTHLISIIDNDISNEIVVDFPPLHVELQKKELSGKWLAILIGGATKNYRFTDNEFVEIVQNSITLAKKLGYKILLTTSRRTPLGVEKRLGELCKKESDTIHRCVLFNQKPQKVMNYFLSNADIVFCTEDSGSMITESILAKKRLYTIRAKEVKANRVYSLFMQNITKKRYAISVFADEIQKLTLNENLKYIETLPTKKITEALEKTLNKADE